MKRIFFIIITFLWVMRTMAQPRPFEIDSSFIPTLDFMQKTWNGEYDGLEPNSKMILSISRVLILNTDMSYTNKVIGQVKNQSDEVVLRYEKGTYQYDTETRILLYSIEMDSTLDINILLQGEDLKYTANHYTLDEKKSSTEEVQFTFANNDDLRQWVLFDNQLMSPVDQRQKAVYTMIGTAIDPSSIFKTRYDKDQDNNIHDFDGRTIEVVKHGLYIIKGKKILF